MAGGIRYWKKFSLEEDFVVVIFHVASNVLLLMKTLQRSYGGDGILPQGFRAPKSPVLIRLKVV